MLYAAFQSRVMPPRFRCLYSHDLSGNFTAVVMQKTMIFVFRHPTHMPTTLTPATTVGWGGDVSP